MIDRRDFIIIVLVGFISAVTLYPAITVSVAEYDPWLDINDDGKVDMKDIGSSAKAFGSSGDPTKKVEVTNWVSTGVPVWWEEHLDVSSWKQSDIYNASGFGYLHVLVDTTDLSGSETLTLLIHGLLCGEGVCIFVTVYSAVLTSTSSEISITIPVPSEYFFFKAETDAISDCNVFLSFYLTWA